MINQNTNSLKNINLSILLDMMWSYSSMYELIAKYQRSETIDDRQGIENKIVMLYNAMLRNYE